MHAFIKAVLGYDANSDTSGVLGKVSAFYGCVEAQGRGTLHCHMLVWIDGALNPNEIRDKVLADIDGEFAHRLLRHLLETISNCVPPAVDNPDISIPSDKYHASSVLGPDLDISDDLIGPTLQKDLHNIVLKSQLHGHRATCYKYWKGPPQPKVCRFDLDAANYCPESSINPESGELNLRCLDGLVNNYNDTMISCLRCNMDLKFIGSGPSAKAVLYYITDYITKSPLKAHVSYAALQLAVHKVGELDIDRHDNAMRAKRLLQKCAHAMISHQELSAQQVASYLTDEEDHFTSHQFSNLFWIAFEKLIESQSPSPECYSYLTVNSNQDDNNTPSEVDDSDDSDDDNVSVNSINTEDD
ncbi:hypothetical protein AURDEDRAFT_19132, partial [Auricularia subglabra TFB-10046 SS5]